MMKLYGAPICSTCREVKQQLDEKGIPYEYVDITESTKNLRAFLAMRDSLPAYDEAKAEGRKLDFDVIFGIEHFYGGGKEILFYGIDLAFLLNNPDIPDISIDTLVSRVHAAGGIAIHAHPFRDRGYINRSFAPRIDLVDGIEIYNACNSPGEDRQALELAKTRDFILTSGGDIHESDDPLIGAAGILLPCRVRDGKEFAAALKARNYALMIHGNALEQVTAEDLP